LTARADEGMWMVNAISRALVDKMEAKGLKLSADEIYNADAVSLKDAIVSLDFGCTGSMVSPQGLLLTNHHCAYADVHGLSTPEHNYLEDGFWARTGEEEIYIKGKSVQFLQRIIDVTGEIEALQAQEKAAGRPHGMRRISYLLETKYKEASGLEASLSDMWAGSRYYIALYQVYTDIRLVAAPPVSIAFFGGDIDNWEWPQHKCDFALYRIYAAPDGSPAPHSRDNVPLKPKKWLTVSEKGYQPGDFTMILGYPGHTDRYAGSAKVDYTVSFLYPITNKVRGEQLAILSAWMEKDPAIRLQYSDQYFSLSNVQENNEGVVQCCRRFQVVREKQQLEKALQGAENERLKTGLDSKYRQIRNVWKNITYYRECLLRGSRMAAVAMRLKKMHDPDDAACEKFYADMDMRVEKDLFSYGVKTFYENVDSLWWGPYQREVRERFRKNGYCDLDALADWLWQDDYMTTRDPIFRFYADIDAPALNKAVDQVLGSPRPGELDDAYTRALYRYREEKGILQYPDANSTMRLTYGCVGSFRRDGRELPWQTRTEEILAKENPALYDFRLKPEWKALLPRKWPVNFLTDNDITGGNSGSPVLNAWGELIGIAFDGNKESLAGDFFWTPGYSKCVNVDIRFVIWTLEYYAKMDRIMAEIRGE
ncbi:MAG: S46 family peptidase, partial [Bacteroidales bacterium]|nr:S46 family peptidase [Bacteroidales bacterium]